MTKIQNHLNKSKLNNRYCVDSFKLIVDQSIFNNVDIPDDFALVDKATGEVVDDFKKKSLRVHYRNDIIYIGAYTKLLRGKEYSKVCLLFSSKVANNYFDGITKMDICDVLNYLREKKYIDYDNVETVYNEIRFKDLDIKIDFIYSFEKKEIASDVNKRLKSYFLHNPERCNIPRQNIGLQANWRNNSSYTKPFIKFYDKQAELRKKHPEFYNSLHIDIRRELSNNFVYRYEFTIKDKTYCEKLGITNKISDLICNIEESKQETIRRISSYMYNANFGVPKMKERKQELTPTEMKDLYMFHRLHELGVSIEEIRDMYTRPYATSKNRERGIKKFNKIYTYATSVNDENKRIRDDVQLLAEFFNQFNFGMAM